MSTTLITGLYNIGRESMTGTNIHRKFSDYLEWFKKVLSINCPMVIYVPSCLGSYVKENRKNKDTIIIFREFEQLRAYKYYSKIQSVIDNMRAQENIPSYFDECPEFVTAKYETIIFSKFDFLKEVAKKNPFNTKYFIWLDAGTFRDDVPFDTSIPWPDPYKMKLFENQFLIPNHSFNKSDKNALNNVYDYLKSNQNEICAYMLGGTKAIVDIIHKKFWKEVKNALDLGVINNEQHLLQVMIMREPQYYYLYHRTTQSGKNKLVPTNDRMIPYELSIGGMFSVKYKLEPNLKLLTVATKEVTDAQFSYLKDSAEQLGYNYKILGRLEPWKGFNTKITEYYNELQNTTEVVSVLIDSTDVFMAGSATELYEKFIEMNKPLLVGGEIRPWYPGGKYDKTVVSDFFNNIKESEQCYPNSGFIIGYTNDLLNLMRLHLPHEDDQVACFDTIIENRAPLSIDYKTNLIGNIPYYQNCPLADSYFVFDTIAHRYKNVHNNTYPCIFHFPGKNYGSMKEFYRKLNTYSVTTDAYNTSTQWQPFIVVVISFIILLILAYFIIKGLNQ